jgi:hypothetical protein
MPAGRPTKYKKEYCGRLVKWFECPVREIYYKRTYYQNGQIKTEEPITDTPIEFPTFQGFAHSIGVDVDTLKNWTKDHKEFFGAYARAKQIQEDIWLRESMAGRYNPQFAKFFGVNCLGYKDKIEQDTTITEYTMKFQGIDPDEADDISG